MDAYYQEVRKLKGRFWGLELGGMATARRTQSRRVTPAAGKVHTTTKSPSQSREEAKEATRSWEPPHLLAREQADQWPSLPNSSSKPSNSPVPGSGWRDELADEFMPEVDPPPFASILLAPET